MSTSKSRNGIVDEIIEDIDSVLKTLPASSNVGQTDFASTGSFIVGGAGADRFENCGDDLDFTQSSLLTSRQRFGACAWHHGFAIEKQVLIPNQKLIWDYDQVARLWFECR